LDAIYDCGVGAGNHQPNPKFFGSMNKTIIVASLDILDI
jgi:hypothetical protein